MNHATLRHALFLPDVAARLRAAVVAQGGETQFSYLHDVGERSVRQAASGEGVPGKKLLKAIRLRAVTIYIPEEVL